MVELIALTPLMRWTVLLLLFALVSGLAFLLLRSLTNRRLILDRLDTQSREAMASDRAAARLTMANSRASAWSRLTERIERGGLSLGDSDPKALQRKMLAAGYRSPAAPKIFTLVRIILIVALPRARALSAKCFENPAKFDPSRWIDAERAPEATHDPHAQLSFGYGPRICPGRALALLELGLIGSMVARNFELEPVDDSEPDELFGFTMSPRQVRLRLRTRSS